MKIDIHTHTRKAKSGDAATRNVSPEMFCEIVTTTDVDILAITNHNMFDKPQFDAFRERLDARVQLWPGVELDILHDGMRGHLLVIVSPQKAVQFDKTLNSFTTGSNSDNFTCSVDDVVSAFDPLGAIYIAHYKQKKPDITEDALDRLLALTKHKSRVIKEVTNSISAGIFISHGHPSIYGSDVQDWREYQESSKGLPELRFPVESFEHFCLLLEKDPVTICTILEKKTAETLSLCPFDDGTMIDLDVYNDIHVFFGPKGTGKSCLLCEIAKYYSEKGTATSVFESGSSRLEDVYDLKGKRFSIDLNQYGVDYCTNEIDALKNSSEVDITSLSSYVTYFKVEHRNKNAKELRFKEMDQIDEEAFKRDFEKYQKTTKNLQDFYTFIINDQVLGEVADADEAEELISRTGALLDKLRRACWNRFVAWKEIQLLNSAIDKIKAEVSRKTGTPSRPSKTGFRDYAMTRINMDVMVRKVLRNLAVPLPDQLENIGNLGTDKGELICKTRLCFQCGDTRDGTLSNVGPVKKKAQKEFAKALQNIRDCAYTERLFEVIAASNEIEGAEDIKSVYELLLFGRTFAANGVQYTPSSGEASMLLLQKELDTDKDVYILDEPEKSLGNEYINDVIVPLLKEKARLRKKVFIATHDANIAVRTLPYSSVYRNHGAHGYGTYVGNPFANNLVNIANEADKLDWKKISMNTLEGGVVAFGERRRIYGES